MIVNHWPHIAKIAERRGAQPATIKKWKQRGVPYRWRIIIAKEAWERENHIFPDTAFEAAVTSIEE